MKIQPVILSGGSGTRLWPLSREHYPKQLLSLYGDLTMLQDTVNRLDGIAQLQDPILVCNEQHRFLVAEQMRELGRTAARVILESVGRNTAPALTIAALWATQGNEDPILIVMPADHVIRDNAVFHEVIARALHLAEDGYMITFGVIPTAAETGYGYIKKGTVVNGAENIFSVSAFVEKPDSATAERYVESQEYFWNSGIFMLRASVWLEQIAKYRPDIAQSCRQAFDQRKDDSDFLRLDAKLFVACPSESIDYAVMEKAAGLKDSRVAVVPFSAGWSDLGAWTALYDINEADQYGNVVKGDVLAHDTHDSLLISEHRLVASVGLSDVIVIETSDAVLVMHKDHAQNVKQIVQRLKEQKRHEHLTHRKVSRPWGTYEGIDSGDRFQVKRIIVNPGATLSLQMHHHRAEHWIVVRGTAKVTCGDKVFLLAENQSTYIPLGVQHRLENPGRVPLEMIEVQSGSYLGEDDIVRFEDVYGRN